MKGWLIKAAACVGTGCLLFLACADFDIWPLAWFGFGPLLLAIRRVSPRRAFLWGWLAGLVANAGGFYWITTLLMRFGKMHWALAVLLFTLLAAYQGLHWGAFAYLVRRIQARSVGPDDSIAPRIPMVLLAPVVMTAMELAMPFVFPWYIAITQAWVIPVIQVADLTGPLGVSFLLMLINGVIYDLATARLDRRALPLKSAAIGVAVLAAALVYGGIRIHQIDARRAAAPKVKVGMVQANVGIVQKGRRKLAPLHLQLHQEVSRDLERQGAELLIWPESSYPFYFERSMTRDWPAGHAYRVMHGLTKPLLFGSLTYSRKEKYPYNSAFMMEPDGRITGRFDKNYLLVFGEYIPFYEQIPSFKKWFPAASHFNRGTELTTFKFRDWRIGPLICYEDIIPSFGRRLSKFKPHLLVNVTNDAWFGRTSEPAEHLALAVYRSVETRLDMARSVNTGITAFIDAAGRVGKKTESFDPVETPGVPPLGLLGEVAMMEGGNTVYAAAGDWLGYGCLLGIVVLLLFPRRRSGAAAPVKAKEKQQPGGSRDASAARASGKARSKRRMGRRKR
jgi:apolipoprotein N-acyltransferase